MGADAADEKTRYEAAKKELAQALKKKRELDKQLVRRARSTRARAGADARRAVDARGADLPDGGRVPRGDGRAGRREHRAGLRQLPQEPDRRAPPHRSHGERPAVLDEQRDVPEGVSLSPLPPSASPRLLTPAPAQSLDLHGEGEDSPTEAATAAGPPTISLPAAKGTDANPAAVKKLRDRDYQRKKRAGRRQSTAGLDSDEESAVASVASGRRPNKRSRVADDD
jgi:chromatin modification-related protein EAF6